MYHKCFCGKFGRKTCSRCGVQRYCSKECQKKDWYIKHKYECSIEKGLSDFDKIYYTLKGKNYYRLKIYPPKNMANIEKNIYQTKGHHLGAKLRKILTESLYKKGMVYLKNILKQLDKRDEDNIFSHFMFDISDTPNVHLSFMLYVNRMFPNNVFMVMSSMKLGVSYEIINYMDNKCVCANRTNILGPSVNVDVICTYDIGMGKAVYMVIDTVTFEFKEYVKISV